MADGQFYCYLWPSDKDPGSALDDFEASSCRAVMIFDESISELLLDQDFAQCANTLTDTSYRFGILPSYSLSNLSNEQSLKAGLWRALVRLFNLSVH